MDWVFVLWRLSAIAHPNAAHVTSVMQSHGPPLLGESLLGECYSVNATR
jgi:hypothetical protein